MVMKPGGERLYPTLRAFQKGVDIGVPPHPETCGGGDLDTWGFCSGPASFLTRLPVT